MATFFQATRDQVLDPGGLVTACIESGSQAVLLDGDAMAPEILDLSTRLLGEILHRLQMYDLRLAGVVPDPSVHSSSFQDFVRESNRGTRARFFSTREAAVEWLGSEVGGD